jgi:DNA-binding transcriptional LysR family regulator
MSTRLSQEWFLRSRLKLRHLRLAVELDEHRNLHRAAEALNIAQPAASKLLGELEGILGVVLFDRHPRGLSPNDQGEILVRNASTILRTLDQAGQELAAVADGHSGKVTVGTVLAPMVELLAEAISCVRREYPRLQITVQLEISDTLADKVMDGSVDFSLARIPSGYDPALFDYRQLWGENIHFLCREGHPLAGREEVTLDDLAAWPWVLEPRGAPLRRTIERLFLSQGRTPPADVVNSTSVVMAMVMVDRSDSITAMERQVARLLSGVGRFRILPFRAPVTVEPYGLVKLAGRPLSPGARTLYTAIEAIVEGQDCQAKLAAAF